MSDPIAANTAHIVETGDTLWGIARNRLDALDGPNAQPTATEVNAEVDRLATLNGIEDPKAIRPGQEIVFQEDGFSNCFVDLKKLTASSKPPLFVGNGRFFINPDSPAYDQIRQMNQQKAEPAKGTENQPAATSPVKS